MIKLRYSEFTRWQAEFSRGVGRILQACDPNSPENGPGRVCNRAEFTRSLTDSVANGNFTLTTVSNK